MKSYRLARLAISCLVGSFGLGLSSPATADSWTQFRGGPQQTGVASGTLAAELEPVWIFEVA